MRSVPRDKTIKTPEKTIVRAVGFIATTMFYTERSLKNLPYNLLEDKDCSKTRSTEIELYY